MSSNRNHGVSAEEPSGELRKGGHRFALPAGTRLLEYRIEDLLGHGGFGITYRASDTILREDVAIKEYLPNDIAVRVSDETVQPKSDGDEQDFRSGLASFLEEARVITRFRHPNIVHVRRFFELHGTGYIALDYERGQTLAQRLAVGLIAEPDLLRILHGVLDGLERVHDDAVLHRDLKPSNVILREDGTPVLIDFGAARDFRERYSRSITAIAAPGYSPPEQYGVGGQQGPWTDLYALGAIAYKCVIGKAPPDSLRRLRNDPLVPAAKAASGSYSRGLLSTIDWMLKIDEADRPHSVQAVRERIASVSPGHKRSGFVFARPRRTGTSGIIALALSLIAGTLLAANFDRLKALFVTQDRQSAEMRSGTKAEGKTDTKANAKADASADAKAETKPAMKETAPQVAAKSEAVAEPVKTAAAPAPAEVKAPPPKPAGPDDLAWEFLKDSNDADQLRLFLQQFPSSAHREAAVVKLSALGQAAAPAAATVSAAAVPPPAAPLAASPPPPAPKPAGPPADEIAWDFIKDANDPAPLRQFIERYPASERRAAANARLAALERSAADTNTPKPAEAPKASEPMGDNAIVTDPLLINEVRTRLYDLNYDPGPSSRPDILQQAIKEYEAANQFAQVGLMTNGLLKKLRQTPVPQPWGSIAYSRAAERWGMAWGHQTRREAVVNARTRCGDNCPTEVSFFGSECAAFAHSDTSWAIVSRATAELAKEDALKDCRKNGRACTLIASVCADGSGRPKK